MKIQLLAFLVIGAVLTIGFDQARAWERIAEQERLVPHAYEWDGFAWLIWLAVGPLILGILRRYPLGNGNEAARNGICIFLWSISLLIVMMNLQFLLHVMPNLWLPDERDLPTDARTYIYTLSRLWPLDFLMFCSFFAVTLALDYYFLFKTRVEESRLLQLRSIQLETDLARAELTALRNQLHPHFLFNSFNALATLVRQKKNDTAVEIIAKLSALLRLAIDRSGVQQLSLEQELDFIRRYLEIEQVRFGDKLQVAFEVEPAALDAMVPNILLQPLVENAVKHGISLRTSPGLVRIRIGRTGGQLRIEITNDGPDEAKGESFYAKPKVPGVGLANTRAQLDKLYGKDYSLDIVKQTSGGAVVTLLLPWRVAAAT